METNPFQSNEERRGNSLQPEDMRQLVCPMSSQRLDGCVAHTFLGASSISQSAALCDQELQLGTHLLQPERHSTAGLPYELQRLYGSNAHTVFGGFQRQPSPITLNALYLHMTWPVWQCCCCDCVALPLHY